MPGATTSSCSTGRRAPGWAGLCRQLKNEIFRCPPILVLIGRPQDGWLAGWSLADERGPHPLDPIAVSEAIAALARHAGRGRLTWCRLESRAGRPGRTCSARC